MNATTSSLVGALLGGALGLGIVLCLSAARRRRRPSLVARLEPYVQARPAPSPLLTSAREASRIWLAVAPGMRLIEPAFERVFGGRAVLQRRLQRAGLSPDVNRFRAYQLLWGCVGAAVGAVVGTALTGGLDPTTTVVFVLLGLTGGIVGSDAYLSRQVRRRQERIRAEFPTIADVLALSVSAGEGSLGAIERVCRSASGDLASELSTCLADTRVGAPLPDALSGLPDRTGVPSLGRFVDGLIVAMERGTPLAEVLRAQAQDVREETRRDLIESGGRREIAMMVPVVFLILPVTILFALYPGFAFLSLDV